MAYEANGAIEAWLAQETPEDVLEPDIPIVDPVSCPPAGGKGGGGGLGVGRAVRLLRPQHRHL